MPKSRFSQNIKYSKRKRKSIIVAHSIPRKDFKLCDDCQRCPFYLPCSPSLVSVRLRVGHCLISHRRSWHPYVTAFNPRGVTPLSDGFMTCTQLLEVFTPVMHLLLYKIYCEKIHLNVIYVHKITLLYMLPSCSIMIFPAIFHIVIHIHVHIIKEE